MSTLDYRAMGFLLTPTDAAIAMQMTVAEVNDLVRSGDLPHLVIREPGPLPTLAVYFHAEEVAAFGRRVREDRTASDVAVARRVQAALRDYLRVVPAVEDYDEALQREAPLLAGTKQGDALHIRTSSLINFYNMRRRPEQAVLVEATAVSALERIQALKVRGVVPKADRNGKQRWGVWWRVPLSLLDGDNTEAAESDSKLGVREPDEKLRRYGSQGVFLDQPLGLN